MTAVVILQLQEEGRLSIDDKVSNYLSDVPYVRVNELSYYNGKPYGESITVKQLLQHSSGIADIFTDASFRFYLDEFLHKKQQWNAEKLMNRFYNYGLNRHAHFVPDSGYFYSDVNYFLLGLIIEKCSGKSLAQQFRSRIFEPLKLDNTYLEYYEPAQGNGKIAHSFMGRMDITRILNTSYDWAGGGVVSTTTDLARFLQGLFTGKLFRNELTLQKMTTTLPHKLKSGKIKFYGLGISQMDFNGDIYFGHAGFWGSLVAYCPSKNSTFCGNVNQVKPGFNSNDFIEKLIRKFNDNSR
jgi:D-alanyl-D-alanine carboxypeptidase